MLVCISSQVILDLFEGPLLIENCMRIDTYQHIVLVFTAELKWCHSPIFLKWLYSSTSIRQANKPCMVGNSSVSMHAWPWTLCRLSYKHKKVTFIWLVIFKDLNFCGFGRKDDFMGLYFCSIPILITWLYIARIQ